MRLGVGLGLTLPGGANGPALSLPFASMANGNDLSSRGVTFTRSGLATQYDSTGNLTWAPNNLCTNSATFSDFSILNQTLTASAGNAPDGGTAYLLTDTGTAGSNRIQRDGTGNLRNIYSLYAKAGNYDQIRIVDGNDQGSTFNLTSGTATAPSAGQTANITPDANGYYRISLATTGPNFSFRIQISGASGSTGRTIYLAWPQVEAVTYQTTPRPYVATTSAAYYGPRFDYDPVTLAAKGLLIEEARTNLALWSQDFSNAVWTNSNATVTTGVSDPAGTSTAVTLTASGAANFYQSVSVAAGASYSLYVRRRTGTGVVTLKYDANVNPSIAVTGTWQRFTLSGSSTGTVYIGVGLQTTGDAVDIAFAQVELGSFATSYIPTTSASVTRAAETASMTGTAFSSWYNASEGTFVVEFDAVGFGVTGNVPYTTWDGTASNRATTYIDATQSSFTVLAGGTTQASLATTATQSANTFIKQAGAYKLNDFAASTSGAAVLTDTVGTVPTVTELILGQLNGSRVLNGHIKSLKYFKTRKTNAELQALTT